MLLKPLGLSDKCSHDLWAAFPQLIQIPSVAVGWANSEVCEVVLCPLSRLGQLPQTAWEGTVQTAPASSPGGPLF